MFSDLDFRTMLLLCHTEEEFKIVLEEHTRAMVERMSHMDEKVPSFDSDSVSCKSLYEPRHKKTGFLHMRKQRR